jgi:hypothetical protein
MPTVNDFFPSKYLSAADLKGKTVHATIDKISVEEFENDGRRQTKPVITFREKNLKPLVINKTNFLILVKLCGEDTDTWSGKKIGLHMELVSFKGKVTESVRVTQPSQEFNDAVDF